MAVQKCYKESPSIIQKTGMEQVCVSRIFYYLQAEINMNNDYSELHLDCEYNKQGENSKTVMQEFPNGIRPDIILHHRGDDCRNLLVIEFKYWSNKKSEKKDIDKLKVLTEKNGEYHYQLGIFVRLCKDNAEYQYLKNAGIKTIPYKRLT